MSSDQSPPDFGVDDDESKNTDSMYASAISPNTVDVSLSAEEDDDDDPFGQPKPTPARQKTPTETTNTVESSANTQNNTSVNVEEDDDDPFGEKKLNNKSSSSSSPTTPTPVASNVLQSTPKPQESALYSADLYANVSQSPPPTTTDSQVSSNATVSRPVAKRVNDGDIEITVSDPTKVGDGMSSYMTYRITTKTTLSIFTKPEFSVSRRFSDFLGLHAKLVNKHLQKGIIVPSPPEKDTVSMAKVKISKEENIPSDFIDRRRALLERYLNRLTRNNKLIEDDDVREFLEMPNDLPKSKETAALSGAGMLRAFTGISNSIQKLTTKTGEQDQWFEETYTSVVDLQTRLKHLYNQFNGLLTQRKEAGLILKQFSASLNHLATNEEHPSLSSALVELANLEEKLDQINNEYSYKEYSILTELIKEYISLLDIVQLTFNERIKLHQIWLHAEETLKKKREYKTKLELSPKSADKLPQAEMEIKDWESKVERGKDDFENTSATIKGEMDIFEQIRIDDFKKAIDTYLKNLLEQQDKILQLWEGYLPEANKITV